jgi:hypothetical protein
LQGERHAIHRLDGAYLLPKQNAALHREVGFDIAQLEEGLWHGSLID